jgi:hypothetical protein
MTASGCSPTWARSWSLQCAEHQWGHFSTCLVKRAELANATPAARDPRPKNASRNCPRRAVSSGAIVRAADILGAYLAYLGTRFIATKEAAADAYKAMLVEGGARKFWFWIKV